MFFERHMAHVLEFFVPGVTDPTDVLDAAALCNDYIQRLSISQLLPPIGRPRRDVEEVEGGEEEGQEEEEAYLELGSEADRDEPCRDHFDFSVLLHRLTNLEELHVVYQVKNCGMNFEWSLFGMTPGDCESFGRALESCRTLKVNGSSASLSVQHLGFLLPATHTFTASQELTLSDTSEF